MSAKKVGEDVDAQLARMLESQKIQTTAPRQYTAEEMRIREQILAQYSQVSSALCTFSWSLAGAKWEARLGTAEISIFQKNYHVPY